MEQQLRDLEEIKRELAAIKAMTAMSKPVLTLHEASLYTGLSKSRLYKRCSEKTIPYFKGDGKLSYFDREELTAWMKQNRVKTTAEIESEAATYLVTTHKNRRAAV